MPIAEDTIERGLDLFLQLVHQDAPLAEELRSSVAEYFGDRTPYGSDSALQLAARRHVEWFLLERPSDALGDVPVIGLVDRWLEIAPAAEQDALELLQSTQASIYEVTGVTPGEGVWIRDLSAFGEYPLYEPEGSMALQSGDLLVGRIFPVGDSLYRISRAAAHFRNEELLHALRADLERLRGAHRGVMRLSQAELERMFWGGGAEQARVSPVAAAREYLLASGLGAADVQVLFERLASQPCLEEQVIPGAGDALGEVLSRLAFESDVDMEVARRMLLAAWSELTVPQPPDPGAPDSGAPGLGASGLGASGLGASGSGAPGPRGPEGDLQVAGAPLQGNASSDVAAALQAFERGRAEGRDLDALFDELERELELQDDTATTEENEAPDFPGVVGAMIEEFLWDIGREQGPSASDDLRILGSLGEYASDIGVFENLRPRDLLAYVTVWAPERGELNNADDARRLVGALRSFCRWSEERQSLPLLSGFRDTLRGVETSLPRIVEANRRGGAACAPGEGTVLEVVSVDDGLRAQAADGPDVLVQAGDGQCPWLRPGDHVLVTSRSGEMVLCRCYPPEAKPILADLERA